MSQIEPEPNDLDYEPRFLPPEPDEMFDDTLWNERAWQPGWRPPGPRPPVGQPWPRPPFGGPQPPHPPPSPGKWPFWGYWGFRMLNAWRDIKFLRRLIADMQADMLLEAIKDGIVAPGPNSPVPGPGGGTGSGGVIVSPTPPASPGIGQLWYDTSTDQVKFWDGTAWVSLSAIKGVTDGSTAMAGQVGEVLTGMSTISITTGDPFTANVAPLILSPGDWDVDASCLIDTATNSTDISGAEMFVSPIPPGVIVPGPPAAGLSIMYAGAGSMAGYQLNMVAPTTQMSVSAPTLLNITVQAWPVSGPSPAYVIVMARRMR